MSSRVSPSFGSTRRGSLTGARPRRLLTSVCAAFALLGASCGDGAAGGPTLSARLGPVVVSTDLAVGPTRLLLQLVAGTTGRPVRPPVAALPVALFDLASSDTVPFARAPATIQWLVPERRGIYVLPVTFPHAGRWAAEVRLPAGGATAGPSPGPSPTVPSRVEFDVAARASTPAVGSQAPASITRTLAEVQGHLGRISTDPMPAPRFYRLSIAGALAEAVPFLVVFGSPGDCPNQACEPMLDAVKEIARSNRELTIIHVEFFRDVGASPPSLLDPAVGEWGLTSEPWLFAVDPSGMIRAKFEMVVDPNELRSVVDSLYEPAPEPLPSPTPIFTETMSPSTSPTP